MKRLLFIAITGLLGFAASAQFNDTAQANNFIRNTIRDKRPDKVTAEQIQAAILGVSNLAAKRSDSLHLALKNRIVNDTNHMLNDTGMITPAAVKLWVQAKTANIGSSGIENDPLFDTKFSSKTTDNLTEGSTKLYYSDTRARAAINATLPLLFDVATGTFNADTSTMTGLINRGRLYKTIDSMKVYNDGRYLQSVSMSGDVVGSGSPGVTTTVQGIKGYVVPSLANGLLRFSTATNQWTFDNSVYLKSTDIPTNAISNQNSAAQTANFWINGSARTQAVNINSGGGISFQGSDFGFSKNYLRYVFDDILQLHCDNRLDLSAGNAGGISMDLNYIYVKQPIDFLYPTPYSTGGYTVAVKNKTTNFLEFIPLDSLQAAPTIRNITFVKTSPYTVAASDNYLILNNGTSTINLPDPTTNKNREIVINAQRFYGSQGGSISFNRSVYVANDGAVVDSTTGQANYTTATYKSDGVKWVKVEGSYQFGIASNSNGGNSLVNTGSVIGTSSNGNVSAGAIKGLKQGSNIIITDDGRDLTISSTGGGTPTPQTLQQTFNSEVGGSGLTKTDTVLMNDKSLKFITTGGFSNSIRVSENDSNFTDIQKGRIQLWASGRQFPDLHFYGPKWGGTGMNEKMGIGYDNLNDIFGHGHNYIDYRDSSNFYIERNGGVQAGFFYTGQTQLGVIGSVILQPTGTGTLKDNGRLLQVYKSTYLADSVLMPNLFRKTTLAGTDSILARDANGQTFVVPTSAIGGGGTTTDSAKLYVQWPLKQINDTTIGRPNWVVSASSAATLTPVIDTTEIFSVSALATAATIAAPTGTPKAAQQLLFRIKDNGTAQGLTWNAIYRASTDFALPTTTTAGKWIYVQFIWNEIDSKYDGIGYTKGF